MFEALFFATFLALYYAVLLERHPERVGVFEVLLYIWIAAFAYEEFGEFRDAGTLFYAADFWSLWDLGIILVGVTFLVASGCIPLPLIDRVPFDKCRLDLSVLRWDTS